METCVYLISQFYFISTTSLTSLCVHQVQKTDNYRIYLCISLGVGFGESNKNKERSTNCYHMLWSHQILILIREQRSCLCGPHLHHQNCHFLLPAIDYVPSLCRNHPCSIPILSIRATIIKLSHMTSKIISYSMKFPLCLWILYLVIHIKVKFKYFVFI